MSEPKKTPEVSSESFPINKRLVLKKVFTPFLFFIAICWFIWRSFSISWWVIGIFFVVVILTAFFNFLSIKAFYYKLEKDYFLIKRNIMTPKEIIIEYDRIKDIVIYRDFLDHLFSLYQLRFESTLTSPPAHNMAYIDGLDKVEAHELKIVLDNLVKDAIKRSGERVRNG